MYNLNSQFEVMSLILSSRIKSRIKEYIIFYNKVLSKKLDILSKIISYDNNTLYYLNISKYSVEVKDHKKMKLLIHNLLDYTILYNIAQNFTNTDNIDLEKEYFKCYNNATKLLELKNSDYGNAYNMHGLAGIITRIREKLNRIKNINAINTILTDETLVDTINDLVGYCILYLIECEYNNTH